MSKEKEIAFCTKNGTYKMENRIRTLEQLIQAAMDKKAVVVPASHAWQKPKPASIIIHLQGTVIHRLLQMGIFIYHKKEKEETWTPKKKTKKAQTLQ